MKTGLSGFLHKVGIKKSRKYPIQRDESGRSLRQRAFAAFDGGKRPAEVSPLLDAKRNTIQRYFADWKKLPRYFNFQYKIQRAIIKNDTGLSDQFVEALGDYLGMSREEVVSRLHKPWGVKRALMGKWPNFKRDRVDSEAEIRLQAALTLIHFAEKAGMTPQEILQEIQGFLKRALEKNQSKAKLT